MTGSLALPRRAAPTWDTLSTHQVNVLLQALDVHARLIQACHQDARRALRSRKPVAYLVDYQLIWRYIYHEVSVAPERILELDYLFSEHDIPILIGLGTELEIHSDLARRTGVDPTSEHVRRATSLSDYMEAVADSTRQHTTEALVKFSKESPRALRALQRLNELLSRPNVHRTADIKELDEPYDERTYDLARGILDATRPKLTNNNLADALNIGQIVALRRSDYDCYPYLLTDSGFLLDETRYAGEPGSRGYQNRTNIGRTPLTAIYSRVAGRVYGDPNETVSRTNWLSLSAERCRYELRESRGYREEVDDATEYEWQSHVHNNQLEQPLLDQLRELSRFIEDPLIGETQSVYDTLRMTSANLSFQRGLRPTQAESPRRVFDLILGVSRSLEVERGPVLGLDQAWKSAMDVQVETRPEYRLFRFTDKSRSEYLVVERHASHFVCRWPTGSKFERLIASFSAAFSRHNIEELLLAVGTDEEVAYFDATLPFTLSEILSECEGTVRWIRANSTSFDLYGDVLSPPGVEPVVGVVAEKLDWEHVAELYSNTSARFVFQSWMRQALQHCAEYEGPDQK